MKMLSCILQVHSITFSYPSEVQEPDASETSSSARLVVRHWYRVFVQIGASEVCPEHIAVSGTVGIADKSNFAWLFCSIRPAFARCSSAPRCRERLPAHLLSIRASAALHCLGALRMAQGTVVLLSLSSRTGGTTSNCRSVPHVQKRAQAERKSRWAEIRVEDARCFQRPESIVIPNRTLEVEGCLCLSAPAGIFFARL